MKLLGLALIVALSTTGCFSSSPSPRPTRQQPPPSAPPRSGPPVVTGSSGYFALVLEGVDLDPGFGGGYAPDVYVSVLVQGTQATSALAYGTFDPVWNEALVVADEPSFESGIDLQVWANDGGGAALVGEAQFLPTPDEFDGATIDLGGFDYVADARISLQPQ